MPILPPAQPSPSPAGAGVEPAAMTSHAPTPDPVALLFHVITDRAVGVEVVERLLAAAGVSEGSLGRLRTRRAGDRCVERGQTCIGFRERAKAG